MANPVTEVTQQSKARHKEDFLNAFSPFIADAAAVTYKGAPADVQGKLRRVVDVWRERNIFDREVLQDLETRLAGESISRHQNLFPLLTLSGQRLIGRDPQLMLAGLAVTRSARPRGPPFRRSSPPWLRRSRPLSRPSSP